MALLILALLQDRKSGSAGMPRPSSYAVFCLKKKTARTPPRGRGPLPGLRRLGGAGHGDDAHHGRRRLLIARSAGRRAVLSFPTRRSSDLKVSAEVDLVHQQTQNQRYGSSHIGATA